MTDMPEFKPSDLNNELYARAQAQFTNVDDIILRAYRRYVALLRIDQLCETPEQALAHIDKFETATLDELLSNETTS